MRCAAYCKAVLTLGLAVQILADGMMTGTEKCENGTVRLRTSPDDMTPNKGYVQHCIGGEWRYLCSSTFSRVDANIICRQLGYNDQGAVKSKKMAKKPFETGPYFQFEKGSCAGGESVLTECTGITTAPSCNYNQGSVNCTLANCSDGDIRLVGGDTIRDGHVEVCVGDRWSTVCYNPTLTGTVCDRLGFTGQGSQPKQQMIPKLKVNCSINDEMELTCNNVSKEGTCLGMIVECQKRPYYDNNCTEFLNKSDQGNTNCPTNCPTAALGALVGLLTIAVGAMVIGGTMYIVKHKIQQSRVTKQLNESQHSANPNTQPSYSEIGPHYDTLDRNDPPKIPPYQPDHLPPVREVSEDEFYNAEDHTYAVVNKKDKVKKQEGVANYWSHPLKGREQMNKNQHSQYRCSVRIELESIFA